MTNLTRRRLLKTAALLPLAVACDGWAGQVVRPRSDASAEASFDIQVDRPGRKISQALAGLSYETLQVVGGTYFSARNTELVRLFRQLNPHGVLRIGGNSSDYTVWSEYHGTLPVQTRDGHERKYVLHPKALHELAGFLDATGWKLIFGVNLKIGIPKMGAELAVAVRQAVGDRLLAIQIGNEPDDFESFHREYAAYSAAWTPYAKAIHAQGIPIGGPDTGGSTDWVIDYARQHGNESVFLSRHYYRGGEQHGSIKDLLSGAPGFYKQVDQIMRMADAMHLPFCITEGNSYWGGGRPGVSNTFASALWGADFLLALAQRGVAGMNFHGGTLAVDQASLGNTVHPDMGGSLAARRDAVTAYYGPIAGDPTLGFQPSPLYYGLQLAQRFAGARVLPGKLDAGGAKLTAYAARQGHTVQVVLINKDAIHDAAVSVRGLQGIVPRKFVRLSAPTLTSRQGTVFDDVPIGKPTKRRADGWLPIQVPCASAEWLLFEGSA